MSADRHMEKEVSASLHFVQALKMTGEVRSGARLQRVIIRRLIECMLDHVGEERPSTVECAANPALTMLFWLRVLQLRFAIADWAMVSAATLTAERQILEIKQLELVGEDGLESCGLAGVVDNKPIIAITASAHVESVMVRIGGFNDAAVSYFGRNRLAAAFTPNSKTRI